MRKWIDSAFALVRDRLRDFPSIRKAQNITGPERDTCERYGEHVIGTMLASGFNPPSQDLVALNQDETTRQHARDWLTERADYREKWERWKSFKDDVLEIAVIALIGIEIALSLIFGLVAIHEGNQQADTLAKVKQSTADTASAMQLAKDSLSTLTSDQAKSLERLKEMNEKLQASLSTTGTMASALKKQLVILKEQQDEHKTQLAKKPKLELYIGSVPAYPATGASIPIREQTDTKMTLDLNLKNDGDAPAREAELRVVVFAKDVALQTSAPSERTGEPADATTHTFLIHVGLVRAKLTIPMTATFTFPNTQLPFTVVFNIDADEIETATPLGGIQLNPLKP